MPSEQVRHSAFVERNRAELELAQGPPEAACARLLALLERRRMAELVPDYLQLLAQARLDCGDVGEAARVVAQAVDVSRRDNQRLVLLDALRVQALVLTRQERWGDAAGVLEEGLSLARALPYPYAEARLLHMYGELPWRAYARALGISVDTALLDLRELVDRGLARAEGTTRDRRYVPAGDDRS